MGRPRKPEKVLEISGAYRKNPQRRRAGSEAIAKAGPLGPPPKEWTEKGGASPRCNELLEIWQEIVDQDILGVLNVAHRTLVETSCYLKYKIRQASRGHGKATSGDHAQLSANLAKMGQTPADSSRVLESVRASGQGAGGDGGAKKPQGKSWGEYVG